MPLAARLAGRTRAVARACTAGAVVMLATPASRGSLLLARSVAARGLPVVAVCWGFPAAALPPAGAGAWSPLGAAGPARLALWVPAQANLSL
ncbi:hypothetical protein CKO41_18150 [Thiococcus pfennigii]|nr:hypothetical protein [Thiococcus pfennigii]